MLVSAAVRLALTALFLAGLVTLGAGLGTVNLARVAAADMYPPERRATGIGRVLVGAALGALGGLLLFGAIFHGARADEVALSTPWLAAAALLVLGAALVWLIRVDPLAIARRLHAGAGGPQPDARRGLRVIFAAPGPRSAFVAACAAQLVMSSSMPLMSLELHHRGHDLGAVSFAFGSHLMGMYALAPFVGRLIDAVGHVRALAVRLAVLAVALLGVVAEPLGAIAGLMFFVGVGWNLAYVSVNAPVADGTAPSERGLALGAADLVSVGAGALGAALSPALLAAMGLGGVVLVGAAVALLPAGLIARLPALAVARA